MAEASSSSPSFAGEALGGGGRAHTRTHPNNKKSGASTLKGGGPGRGALAVAPIRTQTQVAGFTCFACRVAKGEKGLCVCVCDNKKICVCVCVCGKLPPAQIIHGR